MKIKTITVQAGRCFNHPYEQYSNLRPEITMTAEIDESDDPIAAAKALQQQAETLVEDHKRAMLASIEDLEQMRRSQAELSELGRLMNRQQARIDELRRQHPELPAAPSPRTDGPGATVEYEVIGQS
jgi:galactokinase